MSTFLWDWKIAGGTIFLLSCFAVPALSAAISEGFESGQKTSYAAADIILTTGTWNLNDALIGSLPADVKNGGKSVRIRNSGKLTMKFDRATGAGKITIKHAKYSKDDNSSWGLWCSTNGGTSWKGIGPMIITSSTTLQTATFTPKIPGLVRCEIRKTDGTDSRINIDDFVITDYAASTSALPAASQP